MPVIEHGCGSDTERPVIKGSGCGLSGVRERASIIGAMLTMESGPNGTKVALVSPMNIVEGKEVDA